MICDKPISIISIRNAYPRICPECKKRLREHGEFLIVSNRMKAPPNVSVRNVFSEDCYQAADAIEELTGLVQEAERDRDEFRERLDKANDAIEELQGKAKVLEKIADHWCNKVPQWIPVTERLPNCNGCYLVWRPHFFGGEIGAPSICYFDGSNTWHDSYGVDFTRTLHSKDVTHWMPLPEPPKEET